MPFIITCPNCEKKLRVPDEKLGRKARCPKCKTVLQLMAPATSKVSAAPIEPTAPAEPVADSAPVERWLVASHDGNQYGPVDRPELDRWADEGALTAACQLAMEGNSEWMPASEMYPALESELIEATKVEDPKHWRVSSTIGMIYSGIGVNSLQICCGQDGIVVVPVSLLEFTELFFAAGAGDAHAASDVVKEKIGADGEFILPDQDDSNWKRYPIEQLQKISIKKGMLTGCKIEITADGQTDLYKTDNIGARDRSRIVLKQLFPSIYEEVKFKKPPKQPK